MNRTGMNIAAVILTTAFTIFLAGCGGGSSSSSSTPPTGGVTPPPGGVTPPPGSDPSVITVVGSIDGFGSIFVGGVEFETNSATYKVDDNSAFDDSSLSVGMVVRVKGSVNDDGLTGTAQSVSYDDEVEGLVENLAVDPADGTLKTFSIFGVQVVAQDGVTIFKSEDAVIFDWNTLGDGDHVEVSGNFNGGRLLATFIKLEDSLDDDFEAKGTVSAYNGGDQFTLTLASGSTLDVTVAAGALIPSSGIADGQYVEIEGTIPDPVNAPTALLATKVELEDSDDFGDDDGHVRVEGILSFDGVNTWSVRSTTIGFDSGTLYQPSTLAAQIADGSADGLYVEVEGIYTNNMLVADKVEIEDGDIDARGRIASITEDASSGSHELVLEFSPASGSLTVVVNNSTMFMDDSSTVPFNIGDLSPGMFINAEGYLQGDGLTLVANRVEREDASRYEIEAPLGGFEDGVSISALGITFGVDANTEYKDGKPASGNLVRIRDDNLNGFADRVEIK